MYDSFYEQLVLKKKTAASYLIVVCYAIAAVLTVLTTFMVLKNPNLSSLIPMVMTLELCGLGYGGWWIAKEQYVEYEYSVTNGDIDIDMIIGKRKRRRLVSVGGRKIESMQPYVPGANGQFDRVVLAVPEPDAAGCWCFTYRSKKSGHTFVVFTPNVHILSAISAGLPPPLQSEVRRTIDTL